MTNGFRLAKTTNYSTPLTPYTPSMHIRIHRTRAQRRPKMLNLPDTFTQFTELGEVDISTLHGDHVTVVVIYIKDSRLLRDDWAPAVQIIQDQWYGKRQQQQRRHSQPHRKPLGGILSTRDSCCLYTEPPARDGPPQHLEYQGRSEFARLGHRLTGKGFDGMISHSHGHST
ncbi:hypothetical protein BO82DRAFT_367942 [Aspergillus uvarum CBS 121591]|uniref:Uncharacterized protein n=1 Tax=Aspergillus uvarum CBS 121591 TaxID=1448315 RepID=A0A319C2I6_9EURO|nr:hypothetical protein BO82DRAFT_367942 [Aspergillus uvarum CBS 121591]PYH78040.1 hypothetical protein BO82DRAFT_367942 [Aspergillus uvarum CBS 121591]